MHLTARLALLCVVAALLPATHGKLCNVTGYDWQDIKAAITSCTAGAEAVSTLVLFPGSYTAADENETPLNLPASKEWRIVADDSAFAGGFANRPTVTGESRRAFFTPILGKVTIENINWFSGGGTEGNIPIGAGGDLTMRHFAMQDNVATINGGAISVKNGKLNVSDFQFSNNKVMAPIDMNTCDINNPQLLGGAIYAESSDVIVFSGQMVANSALETGFYNDHQSPTGYDIPQVSDGGCGFSFGGDVYAKDSNLHFEEVHSYYARTQADGGILFIAGTGTTEIIHNYLFPVKARAGLCFVIDKAPDSVVTMDGNQFNQGGADSYPREYIVVRGQRQTITLSNVDYGGPIPTSFFHFMLTDSTVNIFSLNLYDVAAGAAYSNYLPCGVFCFEGMTSGNSMDNTKVDIRGVTVANARFLKTGINVGVVITAVMYASTPADGHLSIRDCRFVDSTSAIALRGSDLTTAGIFIYQTTAPVYINNTRFTNLNGRTGGALLFSNVFQGSPIYLTDVLMEVTSGVIGGAMYVSNSKVIAQNVTINNAYAPTGGACYSAAGSTYEGYITFSGVEDSTSTNENPALYPTACDSTSATDKCCLNRPSTGLSRGFIQPGPVCWSVEGSSCPMIFCSPLYAQGTGVAFCRGGQWDFSQACLAESCPASPTVPNSVSRTYNRLADATGETLIPIVNPQPSDLVTLVVAQYTCDLSRGYSAVDGYTRMACVHGQWIVIDTNGLPNVTTVECAAGLCVGIEPPINGTVSSSTVPFFASVTYGCEPGLMLVGERVQVCNGTTKALSGTQPTCVPQACDTLTNNVDNTCGDMAIGIGAECTIQCKAGYSGLFGGLLKCNASAPGFRGEFIPAAPQCTLCKAGTFSVLGFTDCTECPYQGTTDYTGAASQAECLCAPGFVEQTKGAGDCVPCPVGAYCPGRKEEATAVQGYFKSGDSFIECTPPEACAGNGTCGVGYEGYLCGACADRYYRLSGVCLRCPEEGPWKLIVGGLAGSAVALGLVKMAEPAAGSAPSVNFAAPTIGFSFAQVTASFIDIDFKWPQELRDLCSAFSSLNLNIELANPECTISLSFWDKLQAQLFLPMVIFLLFFVVCILLLIRACIKDFKVPGLFRRHAGLTISHFVSGFLLFMTLAYLFLAKATVQFFSCVKRLDGKYTVAKAPNLFCYDTDWNRLLPLAVWSLVFYVMGVPLAMCIIYITLRRKRGLTAANTHPLTSFFVAKYESKFWMWECFVMLRKFAIVLFSAIFITEPNVEALASIAVLFIAAMFTIGLRPYKWNKHDFVEITSLVASLVVLFAGLITTSDSAGPRVKSTMAIIAVVISAASIGAVVVCFASEIYVKIFLFRRIRQMGDPTRRVMIGHTQPVTSVVLANEHTLVSGSEDKTIKVWNAMTGEDLRTLVGHKEGVTALAKLKNNYVVSASRDGTIKLWNVRSGHFVATLGHDLGHLTCLAINADASLMACGNREGRLIVWRAGHRVRNLPEISGDESGSEIIAPPGNEMMKKLKSVGSLFGGGDDDNKSKSQVHSEESSGSSAAAAAGSSSSGDHVYFERAQFIEKAHHGAIRCICIDGQTVFTGGNDMYARRWSASHEQRLSAYKVHTDAVTAIMVNDGVLYTGSADATIRAMIIKTGLVVPSETAHSGLISALCFEPVSGNIISCSWDNTIRVWSTAPRENSKGETFHTLPGHTLAVNAATVHLYGGLKDGGAANEEAENNAKKAKKNDSASKKGSAAAKALSSVSGSREASESGHGNGDPHIIGLIFSASDDMTLRAFELNMARNLDIKDPLDELAGRVARCLPTFKEPEAQIDHNADYSVTEATGDDKENAAFLAAQPGGNPRLKKGGPTHNQGFSVHLMTDIKARGVRAGAGAAGSSSASGSGSGGGKKSDAKTGSSISSLSSMSKGSGSNSS